MQQMPVPAGQPASLAHTSRATTHLELHRALGALTVCRLGSKESEWILSSTQPSKRHRHLHLHVLLQGNLPLPTMKLPRGPRASWGNISGCIGRYVRLCRACGGTALTPRARSGRPLGNASQIRPHHLTTLIDM
eukprot:2340285-Pyramimonas_sp.AAC.1